jgi:hypothetical protein
MRIQFFSLASLRFLDWSENVPVPAIVEKRKRVPDIVENKGVQQILQFWAETTMTWGWIAERPAMGT